MSLPSFSPLPLSLTRAGVPCTSFDPAAIEAMASAYHKVCDSLGLDERHNGFAEMVAKHLIGLARSGVRTPAALYMLTMMEFKSNPQ